MRKLTDRQVAVLAAVERNGRATLPEIAVEFPELALSAVFRVLEALVRRGRVTMSGDPHYVYLGDSRTPSPVAVAPGIVAFPPSGLPDIPEESVVRFEAVR